MLRIVLDHFIHNISFAIYKMELLLHYQTQQDNFKPLEIKESHVLIICLSIHLPYYLNSNMKPIDFYFD